MTEILEYNKSRPVVLHPKSIFEGQPLTDFLIMSTAYDLAGTDAIVRGAGRFIDMVGQKPGSTTTMAKLFEADVTYFFKYGDNRVVAGEPKGLGYLISSKREDWGIGNLSLYNELTRLKGSATALLGASAAPWNAGIDTTYYPKDYRAIFAMMQNSPGLATAVADYKGEDGYDEILAAIGFTYDAFFDASFLYLHWIMTRGPYLRRLYNLEKLYSPTDTDIGMDDENATLAYAVRIDIASEGGNKNLVGLNVSSYETSSYIKKFVYEMLPEGGVEVNPLALRLCQLLTAEMKLPTSLQTECTALFTVGLGNTDYVGNVDLTFDVDAAVYISGGLVVSEQDTDSAPWHGTTITPRVLVRALRAFSEQKKFAKIFRRTNIPFPSITFTIKDLIANRAGAEQGSILLHMLMQGLQHYNYLTVSQLQFLHEGGYGIADSAAQYIFHLGVDMKEYVVIDTIVSQWKDEFSSDILYGTLVLYALLKDLAKVSDKDATEIVHIFRKSNYGISRYFEYDDDQDDTQMPLDTTTWDEHTFMFWYTNLPAVNDSWYFDTLPVPDDQGASRAGSPVLGTYQWGMRGYPFRSIVAGKDYMYDNQGGVNEPIYILKNELNITKFMDWIMAQGFLKFGGSKAPSMKEVVAESKEPVTTEEAEVLDE